MIFKDKTKGGYSLIEIIMYLAILAGITIVIVNILTQISSSRTRLTAAQRVATSAGLSLDRMAREIHTATGVSTTTSVLGTSPGRLVLNGLESGSPYTIEFSLSGNTLNIIRNGVTTGPLTEAGTSVTELIFRHSASSTDQAISIEMTIQSGTSTSYRSEKFYTTAVLRQSL